jgi:hypothetical protein
VRLDKGDFIGRDAAKRILAEQPKRASRSSNSAMVIPIRWATSRSYQAAKSSAG